MSGTSVKPHWSFWVIGVIALIWNVMSCMNFFMQRNPAALANYSESARAIVEGRQLWATIAFAVAVFGGALGALLLLMKKKAAIPVFVLSLIGILIQTIHSFTAASLGAKEIGGYVVMPIVVAGFLIWYAKYAKTQSWIS